jgi:hypothetical protein
MNSRRIKAQPVAATYPCLRQGLATGTVYLVRDKSMYIVVDTSEDNPSEQSIGNTYNSSLVEETEVFGGVIQLSN